MPKQSYTLTLTAADDADGPETLRRLRRALKFLLRAFRLRCLEVRQVEQGAHISTTTDIADGELGQDRVFTT